MKTKLFLENSFRFLPLAAAVAALVMTLAPLAGRAQGTTFTYQGRLDDGGAPANGSYDLSFTLFDSASSGTQQGNALTKAATAVSNGLFTVTLDFGSNVFTGQDRWLEVAVRTNGTDSLTPLDPRQAITATPYAVTARAVSGSVAAAQLTGTIAPVSIGVGSITSSMLAAGSVTANSLADGAVNLEKLHTRLAAPLFATFTNPAPAASDWFGWAVAAVGPDRVLIGAYQDGTGAARAGAAYLLSTNGTLLTTFTNPTPQADDIFGVAVAAVGPDRVLIGASADDTGAVSAGAAYLFSTSGALLATFTNPTPVLNDNFGNAVAAVGADKVLIGAYRDDTGEFDAGVAYLFRTNGTLVTTFTNPTPTGPDYFGFAVAAMGSDKVLIGAIQDSPGIIAAGAAYLFSTNGTLLTTFTNPTPADSDYFGYAVASAGPDKVLIGAVQDNTGATAAGAAYLFHTNGTLLTTFTNPTPQAADNFGIALAAVGTNQVIIGAYKDNTDGADAGAAYVFGTDGTLLTTIANPSPAAGDYFGRAVAAVGTDQILLGANQDSTGATQTGAAYLFTLSPYVPGLITAGVADQAVTATSLDPRIGVWLKSGTNLHYAAGNIGIGTNAPVSRLHVVGTVTATAFNPPSDRNLKENFTPVSPREVLDKVAAMPVSRWNFKEDASSSHMGPMAQDFHAAFGLGTDERHIATVDADGVALAAIQGLNQKLEQRLEQKETEITELKARLDRLEQLLNPSAR